MATKYILQPNGNIIPVNDDGTLENAIDPAGSPNDAPALSEVVENNASKLQGEVKTDFYEINIDDFIDATKLSIAYLENSIRTKH